jgi:hypothetical protein
MPTNEQAVYTQGSGTPRGALAFYDFGAASNGSFANQTQIAGTPPPLTIQRSDVVAARGEA